MVGTLAWNAGEEGSIPTVGAVFPIFITPMTVSVGSCPLGLIIILQLTNAVVYQVQVVPIPPGGAALPFWSLFEDRLVDQAEEISIMDDRSCAFHCCLPYPYNAEPLATKQQA